MEDKQIRLLVLGSGAVVNYYYLPALQMLGLIKNTTVIDYSARAVKQTKERCPALKIIRADFKEFLKNPDCNNLFDVCLITLPNGLHKEAVIGALDSNLSVLCEKPLALTKSDCQELADYAKEKNKILAVNMERRLSPCVVALGEALRGKIIGDLLSIDVEMGDPYIWMSETGSFFSKENGGFLVDFGIHYLDLIWYLVGRLIPVSYRDDYQGGVEANFEFQLRTEEGIPLRLALSQTHSLHNSAVFKGEKGELVLERDTFDVCLWHSTSGNLQGRLSPLKSFRIEEWPILLESCFAEQLSNFLDLVQGREGTYVSAEEASHSVGLVEWAYQERLKLDKVTTQEKIDVQDSLSPGPVVVTGGTGFIGTNLVERLKSQGFERIVVPVRNYNTCANVARFDVKLPLVNLLDFQQVKEMVSGSRYVIHLAYGRDGKEPSRVTIAGTRNVVEAAIACGVESVVVLSTIYVFGLPKNKQIDESWPYRPYGGEYGWSKAKMEEWCLRRARSSGKTRIVVLNPSCVYGPGGKTYTELPARLASQGNFFWVQNGMGIVNFTFINNLLDAILLGASNLKAHGERFIINDGICTWKEFLGPLLSPWLESLLSYSLKELALMEKKTSHTRYKDIIQLVLSDKQMRKAARNLPIFKELFSFMAKYSPGLQERLRIYGSKENFNMCDNPAFSFWLRDLFGPFSTIFSSEKAKNILGWMPRIGLKEGQERARVWLRYIKIL